MVQNCCRSGKDLTSPIFNIPPKQQVGLAAGGEKRHDSTGESLQQMKMGRVL
jgi:hypothetical protein